MERWGRWRGGGDGEVGEMERSEMEAEEMERKGVKAEGSLHWNGVAGVKQLPSWSTNWLAHVINQLTEYYTTGG